MNIQSAIKALVDGRDLTEAEMVGTMTQIMSGEATDAQIGAFLVSLRVKGETVDEIAGAAQVMRDKAVTIKHPHPSVVDTCGTGGDSSGTFNISTTSAFIAAGAGVKIAKHGNRSVSSKAGSADVLKALGVNIEADNKTVEKALDEVGIAFLFAPLMHSAMKHAIGPRREIGVRTIFNLLGPLTNPAGAKHQLIGVYDNSLTEPIADVLRRLGSGHVFVVHGSDGLDEITLTGSTQISELVDGEVSTWNLHPEDLGLKLCQPEDLLGGEAEDNAKITLDILSGAEKGAKLDIALINASFAIVAGDKETDLTEALRKASESVSSGSALAKLKALKEVVK